MVRSDGSYVMVESRARPGMCIGVDHEAGDDRAMLAKTCYNGELVLRDCRPPGDDDDGGGEAAGPASAVERYFTGGQLVSSLCWGAGLSSMMTVFLDDEGDNEDAVIKADTFMFVSRLPIAPFFVDDVDAELDR